MTDLSRNTRERLLKLLLDECYLEDESRLDDFLDCISVTFRNELIDNSTYIYGPIDCS
jgi:hypothetical protein